MIAPIVKNRGFYCLSPPLDVQTACNILITKLIKSTHECKIFILNVIWQSV